MKTIVIFSFMITDLKLKGVELLLYALIYSFTQYGNGFFMKDELIYKTLGCSRAQLYRAKRNLIVNGFIVSTDSGLECRCNDMVDNNLDENLSELIRIAKTPWVD